MNAPLTFVYGNCVFARGLDDVWAAFSIEPSSYAWLDEAGKRRRFVSLVGALEALEADLQILRVHSSSGAERFLAAHARSGCHATRARRAGPAGTRAPRRSG